MAWYGETIWARVFVRFGHPARGWTKSEFGLQGLAADHGCLGFGVEGLGFGVEGLGFRVPRSANPVAEPAVKWLVVLGRGKGAGSGPTYVPRVPEP